MLNDSVVFAVLRFIANGDSAVTVLVSMPNQKRRRVYLPFLCTPFAQGSPAFAGNKPVNIMASTPDVVFFHKWLLPLRIKIPFLDLRRNGLFGKFSKCGRYLDE